MEICVFVLHSSQMPVTLNQFQLHCNTTSNLCLAPAGYKINLLNLYDHHLFGNIRTKEKTLEKRRLICKA